MPALLPSLLLPTFEQVGQALRLRVRQVGNAAVPGENGQPQAGGRVPADQPAGLIRFAAIGLHPPQHVMLWDLRIHTPRLKVIQCCIRFGCLKCVQPL